MVTKFLDELNDIRRRAGLPLVEAADIPPANYGYWITDGGEFIPVDHDGHINVLIHYGERHGFSVPEIGWDDDADEYYDKLVNEFENSGWIRVIAPSDLSEIGVDLLKPSKSALYSLMELIRQTPETQYFTNRGTPGSKNEMMRYVRGLIR